MSFSRRNSNNVPSQTESDREKSVSDAPSRNNSISSIGRTSNRASVVRTTTITAGSPQAIELHLKSMLDRIDSLHPDVYHKELEIVKAKDKYQKIFKDLRKEIASILSEIKNSDHISFDVLKSIENFNKHREAVVAALQRDPLFNTEGPNKDHENIYQAIETNYSLLSQDISINFEAKFPPHARSSAEKDAVKYFSPIGSFAKLTQSADMAVKNLSHCFSDEIRDFRDVKGLKHQPFTNEFAHMQHEKERIKAEKHMKENPHTVMIARDLMKSILSDLKSPLLDVEKLNQKLSDLGELRTKLMAEQKEFTKILEGRVSGKLPSLGYVVYREGEWRDLNKRILASRNSQMEGEHGKANIAANLFVGFEIHARKCIKDRETIHNSAVNHPAAQTVAPDVVPAPLSPQGEYVDDFQNTDNHGPTEKKQTKFSAFVAKQKEALESLCVVTPTIGPELKTAPAADTIKKYIDMPALDRPIPGKRVILGGAAPAA